MCFCTHSVIWGGFYLSFTTDSDPIRAAASSDKPPDHLPTSSLAHTDTEEHVEAAVPAAVDMDELSAAQVGKNTPFVFPSDLFVLQPPEGPQTSSYSC